MTDVVATDDETFQRFLAAADEQTREVDPVAVQYEIIGRILKAETVDDVLEGGSLTHARDFLGVPFALTDVRFNRATAGGDGPDFYAVLTGADEHGEKVMISCGARKVLAQAWKLKDMGALPVAVELAEAERPSSNGYKVMWLEKASRSF